MSSKYFVISIVICSLNWIVFLDDFDCHICGERCYICFYFLSLPEFGCLHEAFLILFSPSGL